MSQGMRAPPSNWYAFDKEVAPLRGRIRTLEAERDALLKYIHHWDLADTPQTKVDELLAKAKQGIFEMP